MTGADSRPQATRGRLRPVPAPDREPPHNLEAEEAVLGAVLATGRLLADVTGQLEEADFYRPAHRTIWRSLLRLTDRGEPTDPVTVLGELTHAGELADVGGGPFLHTLVQAVPTVANAGRYAGLVAEAARRRRVIDLGIRLANSDAHPAVLAEVAGKLADTTTAAHGGRGWELPIPFGIAGEVPTFPVEVLPAWLGEYVAAVATATQTPPDLAGMLALAVLATVAAGAVEVQPRPGWREPLWPVRGRGHGRRSPQEQCVHRHDPTRGRVRTRAGHRRPPGNRRDRHTTAHRGADRRPGRGRGQQSPRQPAGGGPGRSDRPNRRGRSPRGAADPAVAGR
jgi:hypothetical protein